MTYIPKIIKQNAELTSPSVIANVIQTNKLMNDNENARNVYEPYDNTKVYNKNNKVSLFYNGTYSSYVCRVAQCQGISPVYNETSTTWLCIASAGGNIATASQVLITDTGNYFSSGYVEGALQEVGSQLAQKANQTDLATTSARVSILETKTASYGLRWKISTDTYTRLDNAVGKVANTNGGVNDFDVIMPWSGMRRCNLPNDFVITAGNRTSYKVNAYYGEPGYTEYGTNGQVMVEVPAFYYKTVIVDADTIDWYISMLPLSGYKLHPWFYDINGNEVTRKYFSAYEGSIYDVSTSTYLLADEQIADFTATTGDKLCSVAGAKPCSGLTQDLNIIKSRVLANNRGNGWQQQYFNASSAIQLLLSVEYASFNSQSKVGRGVDGIPDVPNTANNSIITGGTSSLGNKSGSATGTAGQVSVSYRGVENFWGNIWKWVDGFNIKDGFAYISNINGNFISNKFDGQYGNVGELAHVNGYFSKPLIGKNFDYGFVPAEALGTSSAKYADYYWQNSVGDFVTLLGGSWATGPGTGAFYWHLNYGSGIRVRNIGARLCA